MERENSSNSSESNNNNQKKGYDQLWQAIIRPVRKEYTTADLGPAWFTVKKIVENEKEGIKEIEIGVKRSDLVLRSA